MKQIIFEAKLDHCSIPETARTQVGFYAYRSASRFTVTSLGTIIMDHVFTNVGNGFDTHSGTFTAPVSGYYAFFLTIR